MIPVLLFIILLLVLQQQYHVNGSSPVGVGGSGGDVDGGITVDVAGDTEEIEIEIESKNKDLCDDKADDEADNEADNNKQSSSSSSSCRNTHPDTSTTTRTRSSSTIQLDPIRLGLEWFLNPDHLPFIVAQQHGIFELPEFHLNVTLIEPLDHWEAETEILEGRLDVAITEPLHLAQDAASGKSPVIGFSRFLHTDGGVMYNKNNGISRPSDMCGKTISYPGSPGIGGPSIVHTMVQADGNIHNCSIDSYQKYNGGFYHTEALLSGKADVATLIFWNFEIPEALSRGMTQDDVGFFSLKEWGVPDFCQLILMTTPERLREQRHVFRRLVLAMRRATGIIHQQPHLARKYYTEFMYERNNKKKDENEESGIDIDVDAIMEATMTATLPAFPNDNTMSSDYYDRLMEWLIQTKQVEQKKKDDDTKDVVAVDTYWTNEIAW